MSSSLCIILKHFLHSYQIKVINEDLLQRYVCLSLYSAFVSDILILHWIIIKSKVIGTINVKLTEYRNTVPAFVRYKATQTKKKTTTFLSLIQTTLQLHILNCIKSCCGDARLLFWVNWFSRAEEYALQ